jgi:hypothetical protein
MGPGDAVWARWTAAPGTLLTRLSADWQAASDLRSDREDGTAQLTAGTDRQGLLAQNTPFAVWFGVSNAPPFTALVLPARWFEIRFTCLDRCVTNAVEALYAYVLSARFDVDDSSAPTGGLTGPATDAQTWSRSMHDILNGADVGGGLARAVVEVDGTDALAVALSDARGTCHDIGPDPAAPQYAAARQCPLRIDNGSLDIDTSKLPQGQHVVRVLLEDAAGNRTPIFGPVTRTVTSSEAIGPGSDPALRGAANGDGASDLARLSAHWGRRGSRTLLVSRFGRTHVVRGRLRTADGAPIANAAIDMVSKTTAVNARAGQARGAEDRCRRGMARRAAEGRLLARRELPLPQPRQRHDRGGDRECQASRAGRPAPGDPSPPRSAGAGDPLRWAAARRPAAARRQAGGAAGAGQPRRPIHTWQEARTWSRCASAECESRRRDLNP